MSRPKLGSVFDIDYVPEHDYGILQEKPVHWDMEFSTGHIGIVEAYRCGGRTSTLADFADHRTGDELVRSIAFIVRFRVENSTGR